MNVPRYADKDYIQFLIASSRMVSAIEAARVLLHHAPSTCKCDWPFMDNTPDHSP